LASSVHGRQLKKRFGAPFDPMFREWRREFQVDFTGRASAA